MIFSIILCCCLLHLRMSLASDLISRGNDKGSRCLTGYMTDIQSWVNEYGAFTDNVERSRAIDISTRSNAIRILQDEVSAFKGSKSVEIKYLNMADCRLHRVPPIFDIQDSLGRKIADTIEYLTMYGNNFGVHDGGPERFDVFMNATNSNEMVVASQNQRRKFTMWSSGLRSQEFRRLKELDLRACSIQAIGNNTFRRMSSLVKLYLGENSIHFIETTAFASLRGLKHLDLSRNSALDDNGLPASLSFDSSDVFRDTRIESVDLSFTRLRNIHAIISIGQSLTRMSVCYSTLGRVNNDAFNGTSLKYLDLSGNIDIISAQNSLRGLENYLQVLYADGVNLRNMEGFLNFSRLEILKLSNNEINVVPSRVARNLTNLQILDLSHNRINSWFNDTFTLMNNLKLLALNNNNINIISREMFDDIANISYLTLSGNFLVCSCHARDIYEVASNSELLYNNSIITGINKDEQKDSISFHTGFLDFNNAIRGRTNVTAYCERRKGCEVEFNYEVHGNYLLLDYGEYSSQYQCLLVDEGRSIGFYNLASCYQTLRELDLDQEIESASEWNRYYLLLISLILLPLLFFAYMFRKNFRYFLITIRNSATLSLINNSESPDDGSLYNYDVFVSYCNEDRAWVLDALLPHVEKDCNVSVCLHERDFQVGLSILENIVSCMDRSRFIMLIISRRFLLSQWCQFEMHLAQHRLLETRREDLILVLLEEIPRRLRPNTLHYLMLTKTYIVWPNEKSEQALFWKRMKKSLVMHKLKQTENVSLA